MAGGVVMNYSVVLRIDKHRYDKEWIWGKNTEIFSWLYSNIGRDNWHKGNLEYDGPDIISTFEFADQKDAVFFALKWQKAE